MNFLSNSIWNYYHYCYFLIYFKKKTGQLSVLKVELYFTSATSCENGQSCLWLQARKAHTVGENCQ